MLSPSNLLYVDSLNAKAKILDRFVAQNCNQEERMPQISAGLEHKHDPQFSLQGKLLWNKGITA